MIPKSVLFYWSRGSDTRRRILLLLHKCSENRKPCFLNILAEKLQVTHVAAKKHVDLLIEEGYVLPLNPKGKPVFLALTEKGRELVREFNEN